MCADIDGDGKDELLVALMGSDPANQRKTGVWCYKREYTLATNGILTQSVIAIDLVAGKWAKFQLSFDSAGRIAVGDMRGLGVVVSPETHSYTLANLKDWARTLPRSPTLFRAISSLQTLLSISTKIPLVRFNIKQCKMKPISRFRSSTMKFFSVFRTLPPLQILMRSSFWTSLPASSLSSLYHLIRRLGLNTAKALK